MPRPVGEKSLYPLIRNLFEEEFKGGDLFITSHRKGESPFGIEVGGKKRILDVAAFGQKGDEIFCCAVECKSSSVGMGLEQAISYQVVFPTVYVATKKEEKASHWKKVLETLGLGYLAEGREILPPSRNPPSWFDRGEYKCQVERKAKLVLSFQRFLKINGSRRKMRVGRAQSPREIWVSNQKKDKTCNFYAHLLPEGTWMGFNIQNKKPVEGTFNEKKNEKIHELLKEASELKGYWYFLWDKTKRGSKPGEKPVMEGRVEDLEWRRLKEEIERLEYKVCFQVAKKLPLSELDELPMEEVAKFLQKTHEEIQGLFGCVPEKFWK